MCGIVGAIWRDGEDRDLVRAMTRRLAHRGPDDETFHFDPSVAIGFRRLAIIDPERGRQPVANESGTVVAVCNGEIYNHPEERRRLAPLGHRFQSGSDAEVIPHLYEEHGPGFVSRLAGKFAIAVHDADRRTVVLVRDRLGIKPLYYLETPSGFWFASEMKALALAPDFEPTVDRAGLDLVLAFKHIPGPATLLEGVRCLAPGERLVYDLDTDSYAVDAYYCLPDEDRPASAEEAAAEVVRRFDRAVKDRLMSDVPLAVSLSGGLDSSAVVASVALQSDTPPSTYSVHAGDRTNELPFARLVADKYKTDHHEIVLQPEEVADIVPTVMWHLEEPMSVSEVPTYYLGRAVGGRVKVLLCGEGADELFGGYKRFLPLAAAPWLPRQALTWGYLRGINGLTRGERRRLYAREQLPHLGGNTNAWLDGELALGGQEMLNRFLRYELGHQLRSQVTRLDKLTMAHGVEARCPFLDSDLVDYVARLPARLKVHLAREKVLLKRAMADRLPPAVLARRKFGLANPVLALFGGEFRDVCRSAFAAHRETLARYFDMGQVERLFGAIGRYPTWWRIPEQQLFHIYLFLEWHRIFVDGEVPEPANRPQGAS